jgi:hypothetical protein
MVQRHAEILSAVGVAVLVGGDQADWLLRNMLVR